MIEDLPPEKDPKQDLYHVHCVHFSKPKAHSLKEKLESGRKSKVRVLKVKVR